MYGEAIVLEASPSYALKQRLEDFLDELALVSSKYDLIIDPYGDAGITVIDLSTHRIVGVGLGYFVKESNPSQVLGYDFIDGSILDGSWIVDTAHGPREQRFVDGREELSQRKIRIARQRWKVPA